MNTPTSYFGRTVPVPCAEAGDLPSVQFGQTLPAEPVRRYFATIEADAELSAIHIINQVLGELNAQQCKRVLTYIMQRHADGP